MNLMTRRTPRLAGGLITQAKIVVSTASFLPENFTSSVWQGSTVVGNWLYIDGGEIWAKWGGGSLASPVWNFQTIAIDLSTDWNTSTLNSSTVVLTNRSTANSPMRRPDMFYAPNSNLLYSFGGYAYPVTAPDPQYFWSNMTQQVQLWAFEPKDNGTVNWELQAVGPTKELPVNEVIVYPLTATSPNTNYVLGGYSNSQLLSLSGMIFYDFANHSWASSTATLPKEYYNSGDGHYIAGFGAKGVVVFFWGFMFGGTTGTSPDAPTADALSKVYILTLPAFHWIEVPAMAPTYRANHACSLIGNRQMISIGGVRDMLDNNTLFVDPWEGLQVFDMTDLVWSDRYSASKGVYERPGVVEEYYAGNGRWPSAWANTQLEGIFNPVVASNGTIGGGASNANATATSHPATLTPLPTSAPTTHKSNTAAITGGVLGGVAFLFITAILGIWFRQRKEWQRRRKSAPPEMTAPFELLSEAKRRPVLRIDTNTSIWKGGVVELVKVEMQRSPKEMLSRGYSRHELSVRGDKKFNEVA
ncbi:hypothetical protein G7Y89_g11680 [Cudoniella acicularis]|uniref:Kelch repeat protein n=1 Tax=Cudoniella acicularis TaxID=354080 RepID=A0A8H4RAD8_9HELO|nr:hypothetical protein G7Y89_g11680 [Cudoniella acicularis]